MPKPIPSEYDAVEVLEQTASAAGWNLQYRQVEPGKLRAHALLTEVDGVFFQREGGNRHVEVHGDALENYVTVFIPTGAGKARVRGQDLMHHDFSVIAPGATLDITALPGCDAFSVLIPVSRFELDGHLLNTDVTALERRTVVNYRTEALNRIRRDTRIVIGKGDSEATSRVVAEVLRAMTPENVAEPSRNGWRVMARARDYMEAHLREPFRIPEVCHYARVSSRTLERAFLRHLNTTPVAYVRYRRLDMVRRELSLEDGRTIAEIASANGFTHLGRFSVDFREQFGCSPRDLRPPRHG
jgi:AraC family ethanolamine operon transcriptional activator